MAWQNVYGSWKHDPGVKGDIIMAGGPGFNKFPGNPSGEISPYGKGVSVVTVKKDIYRFKLSLVAYAISVTTDAYFPSYYQGSSDADYQWIIKAAISYDQISDPVKANFQDLFQENFKTVYHGGDPLYGETNWHTKSYENETSNTFTATSKDAWIRIEIYGEPAITPLYAYFKLSAAFEEFRPLAIRKNNQWNSLDRETGFFKKRKNNKWENIPKMSYEDVGKDNKGTSRIRKDGLWKGQGKIGN